MLHLVLFVTDDSFFLRALSLSWRRGSLFRKSASALPPMARGGGWTPQIAVGARTSRVSLRWRVG